MKNEKKTFYATGRSRKTGISSLGYEGLDLKWEKLKIVVKYHLTTIIDKTIEND